MPRVHGFRYGGRPYVLARVRLTRLRSEARIPFLLDTGADQSAIHLGDRSAFDADFVRSGAALTPTASMSGIGGESNPYAVEAAEYLFESESGATTPMDGRVLIAIDASAPGLPSLLGRDILDLMLFCISDQEITLDW